MLWTFSSNGYVSHYWWILLSCIYDYSLHTLSKYVSCHLFLRCCLWNVDGLGDGRYLKKYLWVQLSWTGLFNDRVLSTFIWIGGDDILNVTEESRISGKISGALNATFIALIPKSNNLSSLDEFRPISLCNGIYKIIAKIISRRIKQILSKAIWKDQFGFL